MPTAKLTIMMMPNCTGSTPNCDATGVRIGARMMIAAPVSKNMPTSSRSRLMRIRKTILLSEAAMKALATMSGTRFAASTQPKALAALMISKMTIELVIEVLSAE